MYRSSYWKSNHYNLSDPFLLPEKGLVLGLVEVLNPMVARKATDTHRFCLSTSVLTHLRELWSSQKGTSFRINLASVKPQPRHRSSLARQTEFPF